MHKALHIQSRIKLQNPIEENPSFNLETLKSDPSNTQACDPDHASLENSSIHSFQAHAVAELNIDQAYLRVIDLGCTQCDGIADLLERGIVTPEQILGYFCLNERNYAIVKQMTASAPPPSVDVSFLELLTSRELQITSWIAQGLSNKQIAQQLSISTWTVSTHLRRIFIKLQVDTRAALVYKCAPVIKQVQN
jgi:DNA-binding CsgD family transcriptional regulator